MIFMQHIFLICAMLVDSCCKIKAIRIIHQSTTVSAGNSASMVCQLVDTREKLTRITWQKKTRETHVNKDFFVITPDGKTEKINGLGDRADFIGNIQELNGTILLKEVLLFDEGIYTCIFNLFPSGPFEAGINLRVLVPPVVSVNTDVIPVVGQSEVTLATCTAAKALPEAEVSWHLGDLSNSVKVQTIHYEDLDGTYMVKSLLIGVASKDLNQQKVQCLVKHASLKEEVILDYALVIHYPPQVVYIISVYASTTSQEFQCVADANPKPTQFIWSGQKRTVSNFVDADRLKIPLTSDNNGLYMCNVSNQYGNGTGTLYVHVSRESITACWIFSGILLIILFGGTVVYVIWRFNLVFTLIKFTSQLRERSWYPGQDRMTTDSSSPTNKGRQNHQLSNGVEHHTLIEQAQCHQH